MKHLKSTRKPFLPHKTSLLRQCLDDTSTEIQKFTLAQVYKYINNWIWWRTSAKDKKVAPALIHDFVQVLWQCQIPVSLSLFLSLCLRSFIDRLSHPFFTLCSMNMFSILDRAAGKAGGKSNDLYTTVNKNE